MLDESKIQMFKDLFINLKQRLQDLEEPLNEFENGDEADQAINDNHNQLILKMRSRKKFYLKKIDQALKKIENHTFGECEECGCDISQQRLLARPTATLCINCKEEQEGIEHHMLYARKSATTQVEDTLKMVGS